MSSEEAKAEPMAPKPRKPKRRPDGDTRIFEGDEADEEELKDGQRKQREEEKEIETRKTMVSLGYYQLDE